MELHRKSAVSPSGKQPSSAAWLTPEQKQQLRNSAQEFNEHAKDSNLYHQWEKQFKDAGFKVSRLKR